jgi:hypothetical protein
MFLIGLSCGFSLAVIVWAMSVAYNINREVDGYAQEMNEFFLLQEAERIVNNR